VASSLPWADRKPTQFRGISAGIVSLAQGLARLVAPILRRFPLAVFLAAVLALILVFWAVMLAYGAVDAQKQSAFEQAAASGVTDWRDVYLPFGDAGILWVFQFTGVRDALAAVAIVVLILLTPVYCIWWERKVSARIQSRLGPMRVGGWHGWAQSFADGIKLILKEDLIPADADRLLFRLAPYFAFVPAVCAFVALPFGTYWVFRTLDVALIFILAMLAIEIMGVLLGGWASNNKWSVYGAMREACQMVSYEIPLGLSLLVPIMVAGTLSLTAIGEMQSGGWWTWLAFQNPFTLIAMGTFYAASLASCKRAPFDLPEAESELVAGFMTEYSGFRWCLFFFAEYAAMFAIAALCVVLFLGGWYSPFPPLVGEETLADAHPVLRAVYTLGAGPFWFVLKCIAIIYLQMWMRWTLPRIRIDQVLHACIQFVLPLTVLVLLGNALWILLVPADSLLQTVANWVLAIIGLIGFFGMFVGFALYGLSHRKQMVGRLAVDHLPGA
jgi:NADH-quinone oxidoreductase subunit H